MASAESSTVSTKYYTRAEVAKHKSGDPIFIIIHNKVYDVAPFLNEHPGGPEILLEWAGDDATEEFEDVGHSSDARQMMERYEVGLVALEDQNISAKEGKKRKDWSGGSPGDDNSSGSWRSWLIPMALGVLVTLVYRYFIAAH